VAAHRHRAGGDAFARAVRADLAVRETPLVAVTGYGQPEDRRLATEAGFSAHLVKPVRVEALMQTMPSLARLSGTQRVEPGGL
jgi:CheY-like chemotaxis protein